MPEFIFNEEEHCGWYGNDRVKSTTTILEEEGFIDKTFFTEYGRTKGSYAHDAILFDTKGTLDEKTVDDAIRGRLEAARKFKAETGLEVIEVEVRRFSPVWFYTGKPDLVCWLYGKKSIVDYKPWTLQWWTRYQLASYEVLLDDVTRYRRYALRLGDDGRYRLTPYEDRADINHWKAIATVNRLKTNHIRRAA